MAADRFIRSAYAYLYIGDFAEAKRAFMRAIEEEPFNPEPYFCASITSHRNGDYDDAEAFVLEAIRLDQDSPLYQSHLQTVRASRLLSQGVNAYLDGDVAKAVHLCEKALEIDPLHEAAQTQLNEMKQIDTNHDS